jgi:hypothetical protein
MARVSRGVAVACGAPEGAAAVRAVPQFRQNLASGRFAVPQVGQPEERPCPQASQNAEPALFS